jgi:hypothetical protein
MVNRLTKPIIEPDYQEAWDWMQANNNQLIKELKAEVDPYWAWERRKEYVELLMQPIVVHAHQCIALQELNIASGNLTGSIYFAQEAKIAIKKLVKYQNDLYFTRPSMKNGNGVTPGMIQQAREYPFNELYQFKRGQALCFNHADKTPSLQYYSNTNKAYCFSCQRSFDPIDFMMITQSISFKEAVLKLQ